MQPITLIPWHTDFMPALGNYLVERDDFSDLTVLLTHNRPRRYLKAFFAQCPDLPRPVLLPKMVSISEFMIGLRRELSNSPVTTANRLDLVALLHSVVTDLRQHGRGLLADLPELDRETFLPWGIRLASLLDDLMRQNLEPQDLSYMEGEVSPYAAGLLEQLSSIHQTYVSRLLENGWTTPGLDARFVCSNIAQVADLLNGHPIVAAGFYALSGTEDLLFHRLWEDGTLHPVIHSDPQLTENRKTHWAVAEHAAWLARWKTRTIFGSPDQPSGSPSIRFCEGFDRHSQLAALNQDLTAELARVGSLPETAIVLPDEGALMPVLHHLPDLEPNISMGYPLERTSLARLVETLLTLQENRLEDGRYHWRDVINLIRHPYLRLLGPEEPPLRPVFHLWEAHIRIGERYIDPLAWLPPYGEEPLDEIDQAVVEPLRQDILNHCLTRFESLSTLADLGSAIADICAMLHTHGEHLWHTYLVDAECLFRLSTSVVPQLQGAQTSNEAYSRNTLFSLLRQMLAQERVSFEPEPLGGLQVMGVLETRLLHFKRLHILDAVEERLPGNNPFDPLLPDPLRKLLGLPDSRERDNVSAYNFYRLLMGAEEAVIYYQSGIQPGLLDSKSVRSRFVEQLLWEKEKQEKRLITEGDPLIETVSFPASPLHTAVPSISITLGLRGALLNRLTTQGLSPSRLDQYMQCPKQFYYTYLTKVRPVDSVNEDGDRSEFGSLIHEVLKEYLLPHVGITTNLSALDPMPLLAAFEAAFKAQESFAHLPLDTRLGLLETGRHRLQTYVSSQPEATLLALEQPLSILLDIEGLTVPLNGQLDRVERRENGIHILDYKTGSGILPRKAVWEDDVLWSRLDDPPDETLLDDLARELQSIQIPTYLHLYSREMGDIPANGGLIKLADNGKEELIFGKKLDEATRTEIVDGHTPRLIQTLIRHMLGATEFSPRPGKRCQWCDFKAPCGA